MPGILKTRSGETVVHERENHAHGRATIRRNPMYASFIALTVPGIALVLNNWTVLPASIALYAAVSYFVKDEEQWLEAQFGAQWTEYSGRTGRIFPQLW